MDIVFHRDSQLYIQSFIHFPIPHLRLYASSGANWGPRDQIIPNPQEPRQEIKLFKTRSISGKLINLIGPLH